jgi:O-acetyl-ADP-ribose deacetylase (regulator of RNase III)
MKYEAKIGDITKADVDAIVNPANSYGYMGGGVADAIRKIGGEEIELEAASYAPILIGCAVITSGGKLKAKHVIHAPTMEQPAGRTSLDEIKKATQAALECAEENMIESIAMPGMGTGTGRIPYKKAAKAMIEVISNFKSEVVKKIVIMDINSKFIQEL